MNLNRLREYVLPTLIILCGIAVLIFGFLLLANWFLPSLTAGSGLGFTTIGATLATQVSTVAVLTGLSPLTDLTLFAAAYVLVCMFLWLQEELRTYFSNRSHF